MKRVINMICLTVLLIGFNHVHAVDWLNWSNYSKVTGLVQRGSEIWIAGHGGVMKLDTITLQKTYYIKTAGQLPSLMVEDIALESATGDIWIGTYDNGMVQVHNGQWTTYPYPANVTLYHFAIASNGTIWCATSSGLYKFVNNVFTPVNNSNTFSSWDVKLFPNGKMLLASNQPAVYDPVLDSSFIPHGTVFAYNNATIAIENDSSYYFSGEGMGIAHFIDTAQREVIDDSAVILGLSDQIIQLTIVTGKLVALTQASKLYQYDGANWRLHPNNADANLVSANLLHLDKNNGIWLCGSQNGGLVRHLGANDISLKKFAITSNQITSMEHKSNNEVWVMGGTEIGIYNTSSQSFTQVNSLPITASNVGGLTVWNGTTVAVTYDGLFQYNGMVWSPLSINGLPTTNLICVATDSSQNLYVGSYNGLYVVNGNTVMSYTSLNTLAFANNNDLVRKAFFDQSRNIMWFATSHGIVKMENGVFTLINAVSYPQLSYYTYINTIAQDPLGNMWFGTAYGHLIKYDGSIYSLDSLSSGLGNQTVTSLAFDGATMYATDNLYGFWVRENGILTNYNAENSNMTSDYTTGLYIDAHHNVWISSVDYGTKSAFGIDIFNKNQVVLAINEATQEPQFNIYPNPGNGIFLIRSESLKDGEQVVLTDMTGRDQGVYTISGNSIDIGRLAAGAYLLSAMDHKTKAIKIIKQ